MTEETPAKDRENAKASTEKKMSHSRKISSGIANQIERMQNFRDVRIMVDRRHTQGPMDFADKRGLQAPMDFADKRGLAKVSSRSDDFVYVNSGYMGSRDRVDDVRIEIPPTCVIREQYWACSRWPLAQRALLVAVGILLGAVIGLAATVAIRSPDRDVIGYFRDSAPS